MPAELPPVDWTAARAALADIASRLVDLVRSIQRPDTPAIGEWSVIDVATHLSHVFANLPRLVTGDMESPLAALFDLADTTKGWVSDDEEHDPAALADRIEGGVATFLALVPEGTPDTRCDWLVAGTQVPLSTLTCHLLNEGLVHGRDIARAEGRPWPIERSYAALVVTGFLLAVFQLFGGPSLVDQEAAGGLRATYQVHLRGGGDAVFVFDAGSLTVEGPSGRRVDCRISADPTAMLLVAWGRWSQWQAIGRGKLVSYGRKPWLGLRFRAAIRTP